MKSRVRWGTSGRAAALLGLPSAAHLQAAVRAGRVEVDAYAESANGGRVALFDLERLASTVRKGA